MNCTCVFCGDCRGSGRMEVATNSYPEFDLEPCDNCRGTGYSEVCDECADKYDEDWN
jgi:RecJ-like exonuclease